MQLGARRRVRAQVIDGPHCGPPRRAASSLLPPARPVCARPSRLRPGRAPAPGSWPSSPRLRPKGKSLLVHISPLVKYFPLLSPLCCRNIVISSRFNNAAIIHLCSQVFWRSSLVQKNCILLTALFYFP